MAWNLKPALSALVVAGALVVGAVLGVIGAALTDAAAVAALF